jgi:hypothetical protein
MMIGSLNRPISGLTGISDLDRQAAEIIRQEEGGNDDIHSLFVIHTDIAN